MKNGFTIGLCTALVMAFFSSPAHADLAGRASVIDGDTIEIHGQHIRLYGVDAPESSQTCQMGGKADRCGQKAAIELSNLLSGKTVTCKRIDTDRYNREVAECFVGSTSVNSWMARNGWALAYRQYSMKFVADEQLAKREQLGIWQGKFQEPWNYRKAQRQSKSAAQQAPNAGCVIKGNISSKGDKIYHVPSAPSYKDVSINVRKGERWFCSENEAVAAGWRKARNY